jgi:hypothetical protein
LLFWKKRVRHDEQLKKEEQGGFIVVQWGW